MADRKFTVDEVVMALSECHGMQTYAARMLGCTYKTVWQYIQDYPQIKEALIQIQERSIDTAELKLMKHIEKGNFKALRFFLISKGRRRGYTGSSNIIIPPSDVGETEIERAIRILDRCEKTGVDMERINHVRGMIERYKEQNSSKLVETDAKEVEDNGKEQS